MTGLRIHTGFDRGRGLWAKPDRARARSLPPRSGGSRRLRRRGLRPRTPAPCSKPPITPHTPPPSPPSPPNLCPPYLPPAHHWCHAPALRRSASYALFCKSAPTGEARPASRDRLCLRHRRAGSSSRRGFAPAPSPPSAPNPVTPTQLCTFPTSLTPPPRSRIPATSTPTPHLPTFKPTPYNLPALPSTPPAQKNHPRRYSLPRL